MSTNPKRTLFRVGGVHAYRQDIGDYMRRWLLSTPWGTVRVHHILRSDGDRDLHDHPWDFASFLLSGGYREWMADGLLSEGRQKFADIPRWSLVRRRAESLHRLELTSGPVWTFVVTGPIRRQWGFQTPSGWVLWTDHEGGAS